MESVFFCSWANKKITFYVLEKLQINTGTYRETTKYTSTIHKKCRLDVCEISSRNNF